MSSDLVKLASEPISADNPAGDEMREDPDFDKVDMEIRKIGSLSSDTVDWGEVVKSGTTILTQKSKDLRIASYLCMGLFQEQGYSGLRAGLEIYVNLLENFWETLYPVIRRMRGRIGAVEWLSSDRITQAVAEKAPTVDEAEAVQACAEHMERLIQLVNEKFEDKAPNLVELRKAIQSHAAKMKVEEPQPAAEASEKPASQRPAAPSALAAIEITSVADARRLISRATAFLRESQPTDPLPYRLSRVIVWHPMPLPNANNGKTGIPGVLPQMVQGFQNLFASAQWDKLLRQSEARLPDSPLWFDLQRFIDYAMEGLGEDYQEARQVVREELGRLVQRLPGIVELQFQNGIPFANDQTKMWINAEILPAVAPAEPPASTAVAANGAESKTKGDTSSDDGSFDKVATEARRLAAGGKLQDAVSLLQQRLSAASMRREQFLWKLNLAKLCMEAGHPRLALPQLESLDDEIRQFSLEQWEPHLSVEVVRTFLQCQQKLMQDAKRPPAEIAEQTSELYARLCRLDMLSALTLDGGS